MRCTEHIAKWMRNMIKILNILYIRKYLNILPLKKKLLNGKKKCWLKNNLIILEHN